MPIDKSKIANFNEIWARFDPDGKNILKKKKFHEFIQAFMIENWESSMASRPYIDNEDADIKEDEDPDHPRPLKFIGVKEFSERCTNFLYDSLDINNEGFVTQKQCLHCVKGLSGYLQGFELKVYFRVLDTDRDQKVTRKQIVKMKYLLGLPYSESTMLKNFDNKLGKEFKKVNFKKFYYLFKDRPTEEDTAYDPKLFTLKETDEGKGGCCLLI
ncbi:EF hand family protein [Trichomonas vaginalis G3]|uniref:EF hand family protein n=1 Tax=Trichomonas vaginalis (strain ATCC PRA-98 / G3) TaxID=412133 RepID=A2E0U2_TRIV3|nr:EF-hand family [Trichomonas vaginalis G3]EAY13697.1 EF hand family protein [Trichomonas vaginalis G3]KAI5529607.1 EF-hand family [Trichomonas vaginalis G3]|eukprot:XP_001325920.1 EF hand family protein [Trichomonas vaginalis G3]